MTKNKPQKHVVLTSHPSPHGEKPIAISWGHPDVSIRGPVIASLSHHDRRNAIGTHSGSYMVYRALAVASGHLDREHIPDLTNTSPSVKIGPFDSWKNPDQIVSIDPYGAIVGDCFADHLLSGIDVRPTIAITKAHIHLPELRDAIASKRLRPDGNILFENASAQVTKAAIEPVWYLPGIARRFNIGEGELRRCLFEQTGGMFPELVTRSDLSLFLPPIGGQTLYIFGDTSALSTQNPSIACRVHDECNGSDVFGSDICTCRPYLTHGIEVCIQHAQQGGVGIIVYNRKEGRALGEVTKFLVYNARKRQEGGDTAANYFERTECVAGVQDMRFQELMPDVIHWLGIKMIDKFVSMSNMKYDALINSGIDVKNRIAIPEELIPNDAQVEMDAKKAAGYYSETGSPDETELKKPKGRGF